ncbi:cysteine dioxygenase family protein [Limobrevibacterium gyesilva]|uniref:Cysteine dioxygenase family protein n=1 Tax=Limobrevibacterium gyesilva TaxID=2991712 RepID=A0AA42CGM5_9PROT|nr:cysteine dioxygenase family protein [Limobrevibacterium gyesilva]MCW3473990.1 cysteine dioxygenase family protein [Limobrevibacterium gyesilva]
MNALAPIAVPTPLARLLADVADAARVPLAARDRAMAAALAPYLGDPGLLEGRDCPCNPDRYTRHLLHNDPASGYAVVAIVWAPGQMSPVHGHRTWCAFGVQRGWLTETFFRPDGDIALPTTCLARRPGDVCHAPADPRAIHRLANLGTQEAVSVHVYGVAFDRFGDGVNHVWAA